MGRVQKKVTGDFGLTLGIKNVLNLACAETRRLGHTYIGTEHILLGLIREGEGIAAIILEDVDGSRAFYVFKRGKL